LHSELRRRAASRRALPCPSSLSVFFVCPLRYDARHRKPRQCVYALNLGGTGISPPDSFSFRSSVRFRSRFRSRSSSSSTTSGDMFYCSGSRQLNHSSFSLLSFPKFSRLRHPPSLAVARFSVTENMYRPTLKYR